MEGQQFSTDKSLFTFSIYLTVSLFVCFSIQAFTFGRAGECYFFFIHVFMYLFVFVYSFVFVCVCFFVLFFAISSFENKES